MRPPPLVSVVIPVYNTADHLGQCLESVTRQTYGRFECIVADNQSDDGSSDIASEYAAADDRIRHIRFRDFVGQRENFNRALLEISPDSVFTKMVLADDWIFPRCLERMVAVGSRSHRIGLVSSYRLVESAVENDGLPFPTEKLPGRDIIRLHLVERISLFGSPTSVMYRSDLVRDSAEFFADDQPNWDTTKCFEIVNDWDFGFVHEVLTFTRREAGSFFDRQRWLDPWYITRMMHLKRFGPGVLSPEEMARASAELMSEYNDFLAKRLLSRPGADFWSYHRSRLATVGERIRWWTVVRGAVRRLLCPGRMLPSH